MCGAAEEPTLDSGTGLSVIPSFPPESSPPARFSFINLLKTSVFTESPVQPDVMDEREPAHLTHKEPERQPVVCAGDSNIMFGASADPTGQSPIKVQVLSAFQFSKSDSFSTESELPKSINEPHLISNNNNKATFPQQGTCFTAEIPPFVWSLMLFHQEAWNMDNHVNTIPSTA